MNGIGLVLITGASGRGTLRSNGVTKWAQSLKVFQYAEEIGGIFFE